MTNVIACIDGTEVSTSVCDYGVWASKRMDAPLEFLHVLDKSEYPVKGDLSGSIGLGSRKTLLDELTAIDEKRGKLAMEQGKLMLDAAVEEAIANGIPSPARRQYHGGLAETLADIEESSRLLVMGKHKDHLRAHVGSRLETVVRIMHRPILIATTKFKAPQRVMIAFDGSATTRKGIEIIAKSPLFRGLPCHLVMVGKDNEGNREQLSWAQKTLEDGGFEAPATIIDGEVEPSLAGYLSAHDIDMLIMGAYGHSVIRRFLVGSTTTSVIRNASIPVLLLR